MISPTSTMTREQLTVESRQVRSGPRGKISRVKSVIPSHQAGLRYHHNAVFQQSFNVPSNLFMNGGAKCTLRIQGSQFTRTKSFCLQFEVSHSSGCAYLPASHWFDRISIFTSGGSKHAQTITASGIEAFYNVYQNRALDGVLTEDAVLFDRSFSCNCTGTRFSGANCETEVVERGCPANTVKVAVTGECRGFSLAVGSTRIITTPELDRIDPPPLPATTTLAVGVVVPAPPRWKLPRHRSCGEAQ